MIKVGDRVRCRTPSVECTDGEGFYVARNGTVVAIPAHRRFAVVDFGGWRECVFLRNGEIFVTENEKKNAEAQSLRRAAPMRAKKRKR